MKRRTRIDRNHYDPDEVLAIVRRDCEHGWMVERRELVRLLEESAHAYQILRASKDGGVDPQSLTAKRY